MTETDSVAVLTTAAKQMLGDTGSRLDVVSARVERETLADDGDGLLGILRLVREVDELRGFVGRLGDAEVAAHPHRLALLLLQDLHRARLRKRIRDLFSDGGERGWRDDVGRRGDELLGEHDAGRLGLTGGDLRGDVDAGLGEHVHGLDATGLGVGFES